MVYYTLAVAFFTCIISWPYHYFYWVTSHFWKKRSKRILDGQLPTLQMKVLDIFLFVLLIIVLFVSSYLYESRLVSRARGEKPKNDIAFVVSTISALVLAVYFFIRIWMVQK